MKRILAIVAMGFLMFSCSDNEVVDQDNCDAQVVISSEDYTDASSTGLTINSIEIEDDCLKVNYSASGCDGSSWELELIDSEAILESFPVQRNLNFSFTNNEVCEAFLTKEKTFDISNLQVEDNNSIRLNITNSSESILYEYGVDDGISTRQLITEGIDVDGDGELDFELDAYEIQTNDVPSSSGVRHLFLQPLEDNQLLYKSGERNLFLVAGDIIEKEVEEGLVWQSYLIELLSKERSFEVYDEFWSVQSDFTEDFYLGFKLINDNEEKIGWVKLEFDITTGEIYLVDSLISNLDQVIVSE